MTAGLVYRWRCFGCDAHGEGPTSNSQAERHTKATGRGTSTTATPEGTS